LLEVSYHGASATTNAFVACDGNGNVTALVNAGDGTLLANYDYGPFGEVIRATGPARGINPIRFSTQYQDDESDLLMYVHRPYSASQGRFLARDPLGDQVFFAQLVDAHREWTYADLDAISHESLKPCYAFVGNDSVNGIDLFGLDQLRGGGQVTMGQRHHNEVVFYATCPKCAKFVLDGIDFQYVYADLVAHGVSGDALNNIPPGNPPSNLGGLAPGSPNGVNCDGKNVLIAVCMRSRLAWTGAAQMYADVTLINYHCAQCSAAK
jgi:RHS repeat-associated protein